MFFRQKHNKKINGWLIRLFCTFSVILLLFYPVNTEAQVYGCTDPQATNYQPEATVNDGSCVYAYTSAAPQIHINNLPWQLSENSGLILWGGSFWTHNDSGGAPAIYRLDSLSGNIVQVITLSNATNTDWEDICHDEQFIYVGDVGNNSGNRTDLKIYKIAKTDIPLENSAEVDVEVISYHYSDQTSFVPSYNNTKFDCEALVAAHDSLFLFTKDWVEGWTKYYVLPKSPGTYTARLRDSLNVDGLITGAAYLRNSKEIVMIGYSINPPTYYPAFMWLLFDYDPGQLFSGHKRRIVFPTLFGVQAEGTAITVNSRLFISSEQASFIDPRVFTLDVGQWTGSVLYAWFQPSSDSIFAGEAISFTDFSNGNPQNWLWYFEGGNPAVSGVQHPANILFSDPGSYDVSLTVSNGNASNYLLRSDLIHVYALPLITQQIQIPAGWSGISTYLQPADSLLDSLLLPIGENLLYFGNGSQTWFPENDTIRHWHSGEGYMIKVENGQVIQISGHDSVNTFHFDAGWKIMPVLSRDTILTEDLFAWSSGSIRMVKEIAGLNTCWPEMDIFSLQMLVPGRAYYILANDSGTILFESR